MFSFQLLSLLLDPQRRPRTTRHREKRLKTSSSRNPPCLASPEQRLPRNRVPFGKSAKLVSSLASISLSIVQLTQNDLTDTPSPSPPRKPTSRVHTGAANLMLDVISQVDAANPPPKTKVAAGKEAILNPYDNDENPLALASKRTPRSSGAGRSVSSLSPFLWSIHMI